ncbi:hypothetical protein BMJ32_09850 [Sinorhizobium medicae]|uniref:Uncharacterized protein n=1 Tax=Sinorhizobium medicae TaxID=110321 RepID=A0A508WS31_9HYPH|nr:hypothetical protein BMJ34_34825 [Sinorhizobium medicae]PLT89800.1 hypothetical protein BMJ35_13305 [Sinorhizobium medicae]PLT97889.1 hypothetical protein BMJ33_25435 [Sinorhizobium medicae]PLU03691.1 hypothetical protein BMJ32_09850 [Sinorhizobium medicae]PLU15409.1 hypothetical protein BMJ30_19570 [Sinorhizobium medicae]
MPLSPFPVEPPQGVERIHDAPTGGTIRISPGQSHASRVEWLPHTGNRPRNQAIMSLFQSHILVNTL